jgi:tRNA A37 threonylcarbamoyladenosine synthetase subunit TsaC/SUA5/YrdC
MTPAGAASPAAGASKEPSAENPVTINRSIEDVFAYLSDGRNDRHRRSGVVEIERTWPTLGEGST